MRWVIAICIYFISFTGCGVDESGLTDPINNYNVPCDKQCTLEPESYVLCNSQEEPHFYCKRPCGLCFHENAGAWSHRLWDCAWEQEVQCVKTCEECE